MARSLSEEMNIAALNAQLISLRAQRSIAEIYFRQGVESEKYVYMRLDKAVTAIKAQIKFLEED